MNVRLNDQSSRALLWLAVIALVAGVVVISPAARFAAAVVAALLALGPLVFGRGRQRIFAGLVLVVAVAIAIPAWGDHQRMMDRRTTS